MSICSPKLFGYNLECTRRVGYGGLYAEMMVNNRLLYDAKGFYPVEFGGLTGLGQCTERLHLLSGKEYVWKVVAGETVQVRVLTEYGGLLWSAEGAEGCFPSKYHCQSARFEVVSDAPIRYVSLKPKDAFHDCRIDVLEALKELHPTTIRVPGGCYAEAEFTWLDGLKPIEERPTIPSGGLALLFSANENYDGYELNVDDYAAICRYVGAEMEYTVGLRRGNPKDAAALVEYCNGGADTPYGGLRASRGYAEPYHVRTWYVGNELSFGVPAAEAAQKNDVFTEAMVAADPTIRTVCTTGIFDEWDKDFLDVARHVDMCSQHNYMADGKPDWDLPYVLNGAAQALLARLRQAKVRCGGRPLLFDEWNMRWGCSGDSASALYAAAVMTMMIRHAEELNLVGASYFTPVNEGAIRVYPDHVRIAPDGEVLKRMAVHAGGELELGEDETMVKTIHEGFSYISVYNPSADTEKCLCGVRGAYEILTPDGVWMDVRAGEGELKSIPPASVAFIRVGENSQTE